MSFEDNNLYEFDKFRLDPARQRLLNGREPVALPPKAIELLVFLVQNRGKVVGKDDLLSALWPDTVVEEANLSQNIYLIRKALGKTTGGQSFIETFSKRGYRFVSEVQTKPADPDAAAPVAEATPGVPEVASDSPVAQRPAGYRHAAAGAGIVFVACMCGLYFWLPHTRLTGQPQIRSIAVMPFKAVGPGSPAASVDEGFLGIGMADVIITRLGKTRKIRVTPTEAIRRYSEQGTDPLIAARSLGVESVLTGTVQHSGDHVRVTVQLFRASDGQPLWTDEFDQREADIFMLQDSISQRLVEALMINLSGDEKHQLVRNSTGNVEAYQLYLKGRYYWAKRLPDPVQKGIRCFEDAVALDPNYAPAYAGLADSYALTASGLAPAVRMPKAKAAAERALSIDPDLAEAHTSLAFILYKFEWNWREAENHFRRAIQLNPSYAIAHHWFGEFLVLMGRFDEGMAELKEAERLDPLSLSIEADFARGLYRARRYDEAIAQAQRTLELDPNFSNAYATLTYAYEQKKMYPEAMRADLQVLRLKNFTPGQMDELRDAFAKSGWQAYWRKQLGMMRDRARTEYVPPYVLAEFYIRLGEMESAFQAIEKSYEEHGDAPLELRVEPLLDPARSDPRFQQFLLRSGFTAQL
jgi:DNA-binding winged helix-turn-helix (wHTH) protein/TolB-like protein/tetratricopeptide (TPR) repeat protein